MTSDEISVLFRKYTSTPEYKKFTKSHEALTQTPEWETFRLARELMEATPEFHASELANVEFRATPQYIRYMAALHERHGGTK